MNALGLMVATVSGFSSGVRGRHALAGRVLGPSLENSEITFHKFESFCSVPYQDWFYRLP